MKPTFFYSIIAWSLLTESLFAENLKTGISPDKSIISESTVGDWGLIEILAFVQEILLKVVLPLVIVGASLYIAYELFLAEGNEEKLKKAWKSFTYGVIGIVCIALSYAIISLISRLAI